MEKILTLFERKEREAEIEAARQINRQTCRPDKPKDRQTGYKFVERYAEKPKDTDKEAQGKRDIA